MKTRILIPFLLLSLCLTACAAKSITFPKIDRQPDPAPYSGRGAPTELPTYNPDSDESWQMDLRSYDLSKLDFSRSLDDLRFATFDDRTVWPPSEQMPPDFDWQYIMDLGKDPGLNIRDLHTQGITGKQVGIAIIDQTLLTSHQEYKDQLRLYEEMDDIRGGWLTTQMHGPAVASLAVGKTVGVAPQADLYYIATARGGNGKDFSYLARAIERILEINELLPDNRKIRVIAMAIGWGPQVEGYEALTRAVKAAQQAGMLVVCSSIQEIHGFKFHGLGREPTSDANTYTSFEPGLWWATRFYTEERFSDRLLVPMDARTTASPGGTDEYVFYRQGGWSWSIPYIAGVYALAAQVEPQITPEQFWSTAMETGRTIELSYHNETIAFGPILDPVALIQAIQLD